MRFFQLFSKTTQTILIIFGQNVEKNDTDQQKKTARQKLAPFSRYSSIKCTLQGCQHSRGGLDSTTPFPSGHVSYYRQHCTFLLYQWLFEVNSLGITLMVSTFEISRFFLAFTKINTGEIACSVFIAKVYTREIELS